MTNEMMMTYAREILIPFCHKAPPSNKYVMLCDGFIGHLYLPFLELMKEHHIIVIFRIPHTTYVYCYQLTMLFSQPTTSL